MNLLTLPFRFVLVVLLAALAAMVMLLRVSDRWERFVKGR